MYEEIVAPPKPKWYHGIFFCAGLILAILAALFIIQLLKNIFKEADAVIFDLLGIAAMAVMVWLILSKRTSVYKYSLNQKEFSTEKYTGQRMVRQKIIPLSDITGLTALNAQSREKYEAFTCRPDLGELLLTFMQDGQEQGIIISPSEELKGLLKEKMKGIDEQCAKQTE
jgi:hypothetical protein